MNNLEMAMDLGTDKEGPLRFIREHATIFGKYPELLFSAGAR